MWAFWVKEATVQPNKVARESTSSLPRPISTKVLFLVVDVQTCHGRELLQQELQICKLGRVGLEDNESVIGILKHRAGQVGYERVLDVLLKRGPKNHLL